MENFVPSALQNVVIDLSSDLQNICIKTSSEHSESFQDKVNETNLINFFSVQNALNVF